MAKVLLISRCAWTLYNFRRGQILALLEDGTTVIGAGAGGDGFEPNVEALGLPFVILPIDRRAVNPISDLKLLWRLYRWYRRERPDIVHHFTIKPVIYGSIAARLARVPRIVNTITGLGFVFTEEAGSHLRRLVELQYRFALAGAHYTFFQNADDQNLFTQRRLVRPERTGLLPGSGVDTTYFAPLSSSESPTKMPVTFVMVARLLRDKGVYEFVEAARVVKQTYPETQFQLVGGRDERNPSVVPQADVDRMQAEQIVSWVGEVSDVRPYVGKADVVVLPSYREGTPRALLEAAAMGKPLITTDAIGCREAVDDGVNGILVPVRDAQALAQAMKRLIVEPETRHKMGVAGREKMMREFDESIVIARIREIYTRELS
jgi:glycosyltransferase involved in cell wall biosynthesis